MIPYSVWSCDSVILCHSLSFCVLLDIFHGKSCELPGYQCMVGEAETCLTLISKISLCRELRSPLQRSVFFPEGWGLLRTWGQQQHAWEGCRTILQGSAQLKCAEWTQKSLQLNPSEVMPHLAAPAVLAGLSVSCREFQCSCCLPQLCRAPGAKGKINWIMEISAFPSWGRNPGAVFPQEMPSTSLPLSWHLEWQIYFLSRDKDTAPPRSVITAQICPDCATSWQPLEPCMCSCLLLRD